MPEDVFSSIPPSGFDPDSVVAERYKLVRRIGGGGMGVIHLAWHLTLHCNVIVKVMNDLHFGYADSQTRFELEARSAARLGALSDHAVHVLDYGSHLGRPFIVMEYLEGEDLGARLKARGTIAPIDAVRIAFQLTSVLKKAHHLGMIHRDIKPENIFLALRDDQVSVKLLDYGALKDLGPSRLAQPTQLIGTLPYMSPEQLKGKSIDCRTDLWAFAVVLFQMITGTLPFGLSDLAGMIHEICEGPAPVPSRAAPHLEGLDSLFLRAFARDPDDRFASAEELAQAFAEALRVSCPPSSAGAPLPVIPPFLPPPTAADPDDDVPRVNVDSNAVTIRCVV